MAAGYASPDVSYGEDRFVKNVNAKIRAGFVRKVYGILSVQLLVTVLVAMPFQAMSLEQVRDNAWMLHISLGVLMYTMCSMLCCATKMRSYPTNYIFLVLLTLSLSFVTGFASAMYTWQSVTLAGVITATVFVCLTVYATSTGSDFTGLGPYLFGGLSAIVIFGFAISTMASFGTEIHWPLMLYDFFGVLLFTFYVVYDTQKILGGRHQFQFSIDDYVLAALNLYLDILNLFLDLLSLFGDRRWGSQDERLRSIRPRSRRGATVIVPLGSWRGR